MFEGLFSRRQEREFAIMAQAQRLALVQFPDGRVEPEQIAHRAGVRFRYAAFPEAFDGTLMHSAGEFFIVCNERRARRGTPRSRFTFAHELGHYFLAEHRAALASGRIPQHYSLAEFASHLPVEREADLFASNLLMPYSTFLAKAATFPPGLGQITSLAAFYGTSVTATAFRALDGEILPAPAAVFCWDRDGKLRGRRMSADTYYYGWSRRQLVGSVPPESATAAAIRQSGIASRCANSDCLTWFIEEPQPKQPENLALTEEVMSLGQYGWLTIIYAQRPAP